MPATIPSLNLPRLPILRWRALRWDDPRAVPSVIDMPQRVFVRSGRAAIALALKALSVGRGDRVLVPTYHCPTMIAPVVVAGAELVFFPLDDSGTPRLESIEAKALDGVRAVLAAHYFGLPQSFAAVRSFCDQRGIAFIEDCAHALLGSSDGQPIGSWGDYAIASLTKFLPVTGGGCLATARHVVEPLHTGRRSLRDELKEIVNSIEIGAQYGSIPILDALLREAFKISNALRGRSGNGQRGADTITQGHDAGHWIADIEALPSLGMGATRFSHWIACHADRERIVELRRRNYSRLSNLLADLPGAKPLFPVLPGGAAPYVFPLWVGDPDRYYQTVRSSGVPIFRWDEVWPSTPRIDGDVGGDWATKVFQLGCHQDLTTDDIDAMAGTLRRLFTSSSYKR